MASVGLFKLTKKKNKVVNDKTQNYRVSRNHRIKKDRQLTKTKPPSFSCFPGVSNIARKIVRQRVLSCGRPCIQQYMFILT